MERSVADRVLWVERITTGARCMALIVTGNTAPLARVLQSTRVRVKMPVLKERKITTGAILRIAGKSAHQHLTFSPIEEFREQIFRNRIHPPPSLFSLLTLSSQLQEI